MSAFLKNLPVKPLGGRCLSHREGEGDEGRDEPERRLERQCFATPVENTNMTGCISSQ
jgi:hypothetical protein